MIIPPLALIVGAGLGLILRNRRRAIGSLAVLAPVLAVLALVAQFIPGGADECSSRLTSGLSSALSVCQAVPAVSGWSGPLPYAIAGCLVLLSFAPLVSVRSGAWWVSAASAAVQAVPQVISFGGFVDWAPALLATVAVTFAIALSARPAGFSSPGHAGRA